MSSAGPDPIAEAPIPGDEALMARLAKGDKDALGLLYDRYGRLAYGLAYQMLGDAGAAEDVVQDAFVAAWRHAASFDPRRGSVRSWLLVSVRNRCIDVLRGPGRWSNLDPSDDEQLDLVATDDVWEAVLRNTQAEDVRRALECLPEEQRTTIRLAFFGGLTHTQIAAQMRVPLGTVKGRLRLALEKLRDLLVSEGGMEPAAKGP